MQFCSILEAVCGLYSGHKQNTNGRTALRQLWTHMAKRNTHWLYEIDKQAIYSFFIWRNLQTEYQFRTKQHYRHRRKNYIYVYTNCIGDSPASTFYILREVDPKQNHGKLKLSCIFFIKWIFYIIYPTVCCFPSPWQCTASFASQSLAN